MTYAVLKSHGTQQNASEAVNHKDIFDECGWDFSFGAGFSNLKVSLLKLICFIHFIMADLIFSAYLEFSATSM